jgi:hypothetical protein
MSQSFFQPRFSSSAKNHSVSVPLIIPALNNFLVLNKIDGRRSRSQTWIYTQCGASHGVTHEFWRYLQQWTHAANQHKWGTLAAASVTGDDDDDVGAAVSERVIVGQIL